MRLPNVLSDGMVLQQGMSVPVWGWAPPGQEVVVRFAGQTQRTTAGPDGRWMLRLTPLTPGGPYEMVVTGDHTLTLRNLLVGEVWICTGQSNMEWGICSSANAEIEIREADYPDIRLYVTGDQVLAEPADDGPGRWVPCRKDKVAHTSMCDFSAVGYFFGRKLHKELGVPVGLIMAAAGGVPAESFISMRGLRAEPELAYVVEHYDQAMAAYPREKERHARELAAYEQALAVNPADAGKLARPEMPLGPGNIYLPTGYYNGNIAPLVPLAIRGVTFYQGESNASRAEASRAFFGAMIRDWRTTWGQGDFPFLTVQLASHGLPPDSPQENDWAELREAQWMTLALPNTGLAVTIDIGDVTDFHPRNKQDVGLRLALWALAKTYGRDVVCSGPIYKSMTVEGSRIRVSFDYTDGCLLAKGGPLRHFAIAGADRKFIWAQAEIDGDTVVAANPLVPEPKALRYAWAENPDGCNLCNASGLPASPFRTDDWPALTAGKHWPGE